MTSDVSDPTWVGDVLRFWFEESSTADWFKKSDDLDARIRDRFLALHEQILAQNGLGEPTARSMLAAVIVLDQFSRNMFRDSPRAFAADETARRLARGAIDQGSDRAMSKYQRMFLYLPFEHSENAEDQELAVELIGQLADPGLTRYALAHQAIIDRFGRFPHRNAVLGRVSTEDELQLLKSPMGGF